MHGMDGWVICAGEHSAPNWAEVNELLHDSILHLSLCMLISPLSAVTGGSDVCGSLKNFSDAWRLGRVSWLPRQNLRLEGYIVSITGWFPPPPFAVFTFCPTMRLQWGCHDSLPERDRDEDVMIQFLCGRNWSKDILWYHGPHVPQLLCQHNVIHAPLS